MRHPAVKFVVLIVVAFLVYDLIVKKYVLPKLGL